MESLDDAENRGQKEEGARQRLPLFFMEVAIEKASQVSPYVGVGGLVSSASGRILATTGQTGGTWAGLLLDLFKEVKETGVSLFLTQEPFDLSSEELREIDELLALRQVKEVYLSSLAPQGQSGEWRDRIAEQGIKVEWGLRETRHELQPLIFNTWVAERKPWVTCLIAIDDKGQALELQSLHEKFGFNSQLWVQINRFSAIINDGNTGFLRKYLDAYPAHPNNSFRKNVMMYELASSLEEEAGRNELSDICKRKGYIAVLIAATPSIFREMEKAGKVDEVLLYQSNTKISDSGVAQPLLNLLDQAAWEILDSSPIEDCIRFRLRHTR